MANTLTKVVPQLLAQGLMELREMAVTPRLVNRAYEAEAGRKGSTIEVPIPSSSTAKAVTPGPTPSAADDIAPTSVNIALDQWWEADFYLSDKEMLEVMDGTIPMQASSAVRALANKVDSYVLGLYKDVYGVAGTAGTTPFASNTSAATEARKVLNTQLAPYEPRHAVIDPEAEANALDLRAFQDASWSGSIDAIMDGKLNRKLGFQWWMNQNIPTHTAGTFTDLLVNDGGDAIAVGDTSIPVDSVLGGTAKDGDIITFAGDSQTYVVTADLTLGAGGSGNLTISPGIKLDPGDGAEITLKASHTVNMCFHRDAIALATRPLQRHGSDLGVISSSLVDDVSGLTLRLEVTHEYKQLRFSYDILFGAQVIRPELACRLMG